MKSNNSLYEQQRLKKNFSPPIKIGNTKQVLGKTVSGKTLGGGKKNTQNKLKEN